MFFIVLYCLLSWRRFGVKRSSYDIIVILPPQKNHMRKQLFLTLVLILPAFMHISRAQNQDSLTIRKMYTEALTNPVAYKNLDYLCTKIGGRLCGSAKAEEAVQYVMNLLEGMKLDSVYLQPMMVKHWERGDKETAKLVSAKKGSRELHVCALGTSIGTGDAGIKAEVVEVHNFIDLKTINRSRIEG